MHRLRTTRAKRLRGALRLPFRLPFRAPLRPEVGRWPPWLLLSRPQWPPRRPGRSGRGERAARRNEAGGRLPVANWGAE